MTMLDKVKACYRQAARMVGIRYVFGGDHGNVNFRTAWRSGVDCSSGASVILTAGGLLAHPRATYAFDTEEFEVWGAAGEGKYLTLWVLDVATMATIPQHSALAAELEKVGATHHCALDFHGDAMFANRWWQATHTGGPVGFETFDPVGFHARHPIGG